MAYLIQYQLVVHDSKYRELLNVIEHTLKKELPKRCIDRMAYQSITNMNVFKYSERWSDLESLKQNLESIDFKTLQGAFKLLCSKNNLLIMEARDIKD